MVCAVQTGTQSKQARPAGVPVPAPPAAGTHWGLARARRRRRLPRRPPAAGLPLSRPGPPVPAARGPAPSCCSACATCSAARVGDGGGPCQAAGRTRQPPPCRLRHARRPPRKPRLALGCGAAAPGWTAQQSAWGPAQRSARGAAAPAHIDTRTHTHAQGLRQAGLASYSSSQHATRLQARRGARGKAAPRQLPQWRCTTHRCIRGCRPAHLLRGEALLRVLLQQAAHQVLGILRHAAPQLQAGRHGSGSGRSGAPSRRPSAGRLPPHPRPGAVQGLGVGFVCPRGRQARAGACANASLAGVPEDPCSTVPPQWPPRWPPGSCHQTACAPCTHAAKAVAGGFGTRRARRWAGHRPSLHATHHHQRSPQQPALRAQGCQQKPRPPVPGCVLT